MPITYLDEEITPKRKIIYLDEETKPLSDIERINLEQKQREERLGKTPFGKKVLDITDYFFPQALTEKEFAPGERTIWGDIFERPGAAIRGTIFPKEGESRLEAYKRGAILPETQPSAAESLYLKSGIQPTGNKLLDIAKAYPSAFAGQVIDIATQPSTWLLGAFGMKAKKPIAKEFGKAKELVKSTMDEIMASPLGETAKRGFIKVVDKAVESVTYPLRSGKTLGETFKNIKQPAGFAERIRRTFFKVKSNAVDKFGNQLDELAQTNPDRVISLRDTVDDIVLNMDDIAPEAKSALRKTPLLNNMLDNPELANKVTLKDTQEIINYLNNKIPSQIKFKHLDILDTLNDVRASQLDAFPEMANVRIDYAKIIEPYKNIKNYFKFNKVLKAIENNFGGPEGIKAAKSILPEKVIQEMGGYKNAIGVLKNLKSGIKKGAIGAILGGAGYGGYRFTKGILGE